MSEHYRDFRRKYPERHVLFVCASNVNRSRMALDAMRWLIMETPELEYDIQVRSAGINPKLDGEPLTKELVDWADGIYVFEGWHERDIAGKHPGATNKLFNLQIHDLYHRDVPEEREFFIKALKDILPGVL